MPASAEACGGLFCSAANPVEQTAERIVFATHQDSITAIIEVQYQGPAEKFAWLLPMPGVPEVEVSTVEALDAIDRLTAPQYVLTYDYSDGCLFPPAAFGGDCPTCAGSGGSVTNESVADDGIEVLDQGTAGPYDYVTISADPSLDDPAQNAIDWLTDNGYDVGATGPDVLRPYLAEELNLVAFKLTKGSDVGAIRPVQLTYQGGKASVPIRPTAVAAREDMGMRVFLLDQGRSVSDNYLSLKLNQARINWFNWQDGYDEVVSAAADEAGGHGFVTEFAGSTYPLRAQIWTNALADRWAEIQAFEGTAAETMMEATNPFRSYEGFRRAVEASTTLPDGLTVDEFGADPIGYEQEHGADIADKDEFLRQLEIEVVDALSSAQDLVDASPYLSRLYTTMSPLEMTEDPAFVMNPDLEEVSNVHTADVYIDCTEIDDPFSAPWLVTFSDGSTLDGEGVGTWNPETALLPAASSISSVGASGPEQMLDDRTDMIQDELDDMAQSDPDTTEPDNGDASSDDGNDADPGNSADPDRNPADDTVDNASDDDLVDNTTSSPNTDGHGIKDDAANTEDLGTDVAMDEMNAASEGADKASSGSGCSVKAGGTSGSGGAAALGLLALGATFTRRRRAS